MVSPWYKLRVDKLIYNFNDYPPSLLLIYKILAGKIGQCQVKQTNKDQYKNPKMLSQPKREGVYKTLGTSIIYS